MRGAPATNEPGGAAARVLAGEPRLPQAGELLAVEYLDRSGLLVSGEGAFVRVFRVGPPNPLLMSGEERARLAGTLQRLICQLGAGETLQVYVQARPVNLGELLAGAREQVQASAGPPRTASAARGMRSRFRSGGCTRRLSSRCAPTPTARRRCRSTTT